MPHVSTGPTPFGGGFGGSLIDAALRIGERFIPFPGQAAPGGAPLGLSFGDPTPGIQIPGTGMTLGDTAAVAPGQAFRTGRCGAVASVHVKTNPTTGKPTWFGPLGRPILFSRDVRAAKTLKRVGRIARRVTGGGR